MPIEHGKNEPEFLGIYSFRTDPEITNTQGVRSYNVGHSDYSKHKIQPWDIWLDYSLNPWDADIVKRVLRDKPGERRLDYEKIIHICRERIRQIDTLGK